MKDISNLANSTPTKNRQRHRSFECEVNISSSLGK